MITETAVEPNVDKYGRHIASRMPLSGMRKLITDRMIESVTKYPQATQFSPADMTQLIEFREELKAKGKRVSYNDLFVKCFACALEDNMSLNGARVGEEIVYYSDINIGVAASISGVLIEPVIREVQNKDIIEVAEELSTAYDNIKQKKLMRVNLEGGTFSVSNMGKFNVDGFTPLLSAPCPCQMGIGCIREMPVVDKMGNITVRSQVVLSFTTDHGLIDGVAKGEFWNTLAKVMADPWKYMYKKRDSQEK